MRMKEKTTTILLIAILMLSTLAVAMPVSAKEYYATTRNIDIEGTPEDLILTVVEDDTWVTWTFDFPVENFTGDGNLNVGLIIALNGEGGGPAFQIHNNDGATSSYAHGTWLMSPWGPTITDGWFGWSSENTEVSTLNWVQASGDRKGQGTDGILTVRIKRTRLEGGVHWAASPTVGSGFYAPVYDVTMQVPTAFTWNTPLVNMATPNYEFINIPVPPRPNRVGLVVFDGVYMADMWKTPHKLIVVELPESESSYTLTITIANAEVTYIRTFIMRPDHDYLALYLHASVFPDNYVVVVASTIGDLPYLVASRIGIERSG